MGWAAVSRLAQRRRLAIVIAVVVVAATAAWADARYPWVWAYLGDQLQPRATATPAGPIHVMFTFADHFEPHEQATMDRWLQDYPTVARRHRDADGRHPQHTWFWYFGHSDEAESRRFLRSLAQLTYAGFGEVELHLHHRGDNEQTFLDKMARMLRLSQEAGAMITAEPRPRTAFGFIHGLWALDNSRHGEACGVNNELILLKRLGCYADFTHPSWGPMHPRMVNRLYYATDDPQRPKSYDTGTVLRVGKPAAGDLLIFEGPSVVRWQGWRPVYDHGDVTMVDLATPERIDAWIRTGIHVPGRPAWLFVKVFTHGAVARDHDAVLGAWADRLFAYLEEHYNDGRRYVLHYVTAREAYNIAKAAEAGQTGDPNGYRDFLVPPYVNRFLTASVPYEVLAMDGTTTVVKFLAASDQPVQVQLHADRVAVTGGAVVTAAERSAARGGTALTLTLQGEGIVTFSAEPRSIASGEAPHG
ncbi:MAG: hypothetical protein HY597_05870 [Candidatus Omnitrophica bacterium]|nr:hypothetical protein [Candidatus Omnitrophota bacterium]